ncbi:hypothetical protein CN684_31245 [Bacillus wiedmannii]|uniref:Uncharacterized protein n=1 Tax=Bacillus wiedmannii TaxID=1890302 RepID=A0A2A7VQU6_9BACI|nr:hypothetical protein [Bacillus wiedmannii]PEI99662.1 hypothetical protein CN684_31245 [Bacillus wiedmannii]
MNKQNNSTWREERIVVPPQTDFEVTFNGVKPNHFHINNLSTAYIYFGVTVLPDKNAYEMSIPPNGENMHARDLSADRIRLYNDSVNDAHIILTTGFDKFNPSVIASRGGTVTTTSGGGGGAGGVITGFNAPLPPGNNNIGRVIVSEMPAVKFMLDSLPAGTNNIGKVEVSKLPPLASVNGKIGDVGIQGGVTITSMPAVELEVSKDLNVKEKSYDDFFYQEYNIGQIPYVLNTNLSKISFLSNDGETILHVSFNDKPDISLMPNEVINDLPVKVTKISVARKSGGQGYFRVLGV